MSVETTEMIFGIPQIIFLGKMFVFCIKGAFGSDIRMLGKGFRYMLFFFTTVYAVTFYKGKGEFTAFTLNVRGVISIIMLITPFVLDFILDQLKKIKEGKR